MQSDRDLLFGAMAVQLGRVDTAQLAQAMKDSADSAEIELVARLIELGFITRDDADSINSLVDQAINEDDPDRTKRISSDSDRTVRSSESQIDFDASFSVDTSQGSDAEGISIREIPGRYSEISEQGRGGMGRVLLVHDESLSRQIVLKELLPGIEGGADDSPVRKSASIMSRFLQEARVTGQLEHPSVAPVYELGRRTDGTLYYTMKLVRGRTLSAALDQTSSIADRIGLLPHFADLCQAIAYAHSRGVIHRDLKPANIMVGEFGETIVLDWGLAKVRGKDDIQGEKLEENLREFDTVNVPDSGAKTVHGEVLGTPLYMAPEQARGEIENIDERSDIYSLGVILYHILTGRTPFPWTNVTEVLGKVRNETPDLVLDVNPDAPPELAAICNRAMAHEPQDRYATAKELADDIMRFQSGALVQAYEYAFSEHLRRFIERHRAILATAAAAAIVLVAVGIYSYIQISIERNDAIIARDDADEQREIAQANLVQAEKNFRTAREAVDDLFTNVSENMLLHQPGVQPVRKDLLELARKYYERFIEEQADDAGLAEELGHTYSRLGHISLELGDAQGAEEAFDNAVEVFGALYEQSPDNAELGKQHAEAIRWAGDSAYLGGNGNRAMETPARVLEAREALAENHPDNEDIQIYKANGYALFAWASQATGQWAEGLEYGVQAIERLEQAAEENPDSTQFKLDLAFAYRMTSWLVGRIGQRNDHPNYTDKAIEIFEGLLEEGVTSPELRLNIVETYTDRGNVFRQRKLYRKAHADLEYAHEMCQDLIDQYPSVVPYLRAMAMNYRFRATLADREGDIHEAIRLGELGIDTVSDLFATMPDSLLDRFWHTDDLHQQADWLISIGCHDAALPYVLRARDLMEETARKSPTVIWPSAKLQRTYRILEELARHDGRTGDALAAFEESVDNHRITHAIQIDTDQEVSSRGSLVVALGNLAAYYVLTFPADDDAYERAKELMAEAKALQINPLAISRMHGRVAQAYAANGFHDKAMEQFGNSVEIARDGLEGSKTMRWIALMRKEVANSLNSIAWYLLTTENESARDPAAAIEYAREAVDESREKDGLIMDTLAQALYQLGDVEEALATQEKAVSLLDDNVSESIRTEMENFLARLRDEAAAPAN